MKTIICWLCHKAILNPSYIEEFTQAHDECTAKEEEENP
jgi:hypothetical protein